MILQFSPSASNNNVSTFDEYVIYWIELPINAYQHEHASVSR